MTESLAMLLRCHPQMTSRSIRQGGNCAWTCDGHDIEVQWRSDGQIVARVRTKEKEWGEFVPVKIRRLQLLEEFSIWAFLTKINPTTSFRRT